MPGAGTKHVLHRFALISATLLAGLAAIWLLLLMLAIPVPLDAFRESIEATASRALGQPLSVDGPLALRPTIGPTVVLHGLRLAGPAGDTGADWLHAGRVEARLGLLALLRGQLHITQLLVHELSVNLQAGPAGAQGVTGQPMAALLGHQQLEHLALHDIVLNFRDGATVAPRRLAFERVTGRVKPGRPLALIVHGRLQHQPYVVHLKLPPLAGLLTPGVKRSVQVRATVAGAQLQLHGKLVTPAAGQGLAIDLGLQGNWMTASDGQPAADPEIEITGQLAMRMQAGRASVSGELRLITLDTARLAGNMTAPAATDFHAATTAAWLASVDADFALTVHELVNMPVAVTDTRLNLTVRDGQLSAALGSVIAGVPFQGNLGFAVQGGEPVLTAAMAATGLDAATLAHGLAGIAGIQGDVARIGLHASLSGTHQVDTPGGIEVGVNLSGARFSYGNAEGSLPVPVELDELALTLSADGPITARASGTLINEPFAIQLSGGSPELLRQQPAWPVSMTATGGGARLVVNGSLAAPRTGGSGGTLNLEVSGKRLGDLAPWFGVSSCADSPYTARGQLLLAENIGRLQFLTAQLGRTRVNGELDWSRDEQVPLLHAVLQVDALDPVDVAGLLPVMSYAHGTDTATGIRLDLPVLSRPAVIANADIELAVAQVAHRLVDIAEFSFSGRLRDGVFQRSPLRVRIGSRVLQGQLDTAGTEAVAAFAVSEDEAVAGSLLDRLFSSAVQWAGNTGKVPLHWLFGQPLSGMAEEDCRVIPASAGVAAGE